VDDPGGAATNGAAGEARATIARGAPRADVRVSSWAELNARLFADSWQESLGRFRSGFLFRGMPSAAYDLRTSLGRLGRDAPAVEGHLLRNFRKYARRDPIMDDSTWSWLALGQHHGLPTRLLDWSYSPYVALHFATASLTNFDKDGVVWCIDFARTNALLPRALSDVLAEEGSYAFTSEMLDRVAKTLGELDRLAKEPFVLFLEASALDERIVNQYALFSLISSPIASLDDWLAAHPDLGHRIVVPAELKWEVRDKLDQLNVTERVLFPGPDGLSAWLKRYYSPRRGELPEGRG
jgi:hypothetical protein